jgi:hypothetical protein
MTTSVKWKLCGSVRPIQGIIFSGCLDLKKKLFWYGIIESKVVPNVKWVNYRGECMSRW